MIGAAPDYLDNVERDLADTESRSCDENAAADGNHDSLEKLIRALLIETFEYGHSASTICLPSGVTYPSPISPIIG